MSHAPGSSWRQPCPWWAAVGKAWWLLCQDSPNVSGASHTRLRDSSPVSYVRRPKKWHSELMLNVAWWTRKMRTAPPQRRPGQPAGERPRERDAESERQRQPGQYPEREGGVDEA